MALSNDYVANDCPPDETVRKISYEETQTFKAGRASLEMFVTDDLQRTIDRSFHRKFLPRQLAGLLSF